MMTTAMRRWTVATVLVCALAPSAALAQGPPVAPPADAPPEAPDETPPADAPPTEAPAAETPAPAAETPPPAAEQPTAEQPAAETPATSEAQPEEAGGASAEAGEKSDDDAARGEQRDDDRFKGPLGDDLKTYWSIERDLPVVQERIYNREGRFGISLFAGLLTSEPFYYYYPLGGRLSYHLSNDAGIELTGSFMGLSFKTELTEFLEADQLENFNPETDTEDQFNWRANAVFVWSPFYGKLALLQNKLSHFDVNAVIGAGVVGVTRPEADRSVSNSAVVPELVFGFGGAFYITDSVSVRLDGRFYLYPGPELQGLQEGFFERLSLPSEFLAGVGYTF